MDNEATKTFRKRIWASPNRIVVRRELMESNRKKIGAPFKHPDCIIGWIMRIKAMNGSSYRDVVGDVEDRLVALGLPPLSHSQLYERARILFESLVKTTDVCDGRVLAYGSFPVTTGHDVTAAMEVVGGDAVHPGYAKGRCDLSDHLPERGFRGCRNLRRDPGMGPTGYICIGVVIVYHILTPPY